MFCCNCHTMNFTFFPTLTNPNNAFQAEDRAPCPGREQTLHAHAANVPTASQTLAVSSCDEVI